MYRTKSYGHGKGTMDMAFLSPKKNSCAASSAHHSNRLDKHNHSPELRKEHLNVSIDGRFYERAESRRSRHRLALQTHSINAVPLAKRQRSSCKTGNLGRSACLLNNFQKSKPAIFEDNREEQDKILEWRAFKRASMLRAMNPGLAPPKHKEVQIVHVSKPPQIPDHVREASVLEKQKELKESLFKKTGSV